MDLPFRYFFDGLFAGFTNIYCFLAFSAIIVNFDMTASVFFRKIGSMTFCVSFQKKKRRAWFEPALLLLVDVCYWDKLLVWGDGILGVWVVGVAL